MKNIYYVWRIRRNWLTYYFNGKKHHSEIYDTRNGDSYFLGVENEPLYLFAEDLHTLGLSPNVIIVN